MSEVKIHQIINFPHGVVENFNFPKGEILIYNLQTDERQPENVNDLKFSLAKLAGVDFYKNRTNVNERMQNLFDNQTENTEFIKLKSKNVSMNAENLLLDVKIINKIKKTNKENGTRQDKEEEILEETVIETNTKREGPKGDYAS